jgi:hypothetical protein
MANANTIARVFTALPGTAIGASSTAETQLTDGDGNLAVAKTRLEYLVGKKFKVKAGGRVTTGAATNLTIKLYYGFSATIGSNSAVFSSGAIAVNTTSANWWVECDLAFDADSAHPARARQGSATNATAVAQAAIHRCVLADRLWRVRLHRHGNPARRPNAGHASSSSTTSKWTSRKKGELNHGYC